MAVATHDSKWRLPLAAAPVVVLVSLLWAALLGVRGVIDSPLAGGSLAVAALLGALIAAPRKGGAREPPVLTVAQARLTADRAAGEPVMLRGRAEPFPDAAPLVSPGGELCLWFARGVSPTGEEGSERPFLLVDRSGACVVLPAGARVTRGTPALDGRGAEAVREDAPAPLASERLLRAGDRLEVSGLVVPAPAWRWDPRTGPSSVSGLPVIAASGVAPALSIVIEAEDSAQLLYGALALADVLVAIAAGVLVAWPLLARFWV